MSEAADSEVKTEKQWREQQNNKCLENETTISTFILKISRKLRDCYLSGLARGKVTCVTISSFFSCWCLLVFVREIIIWDR